MSTNTIFKAIRLSFFTKIILVLFFISTLGVLLGAYFSSQQTFERMLDLEQKYANNVAQNYAVSIEQLLESILDIFYQTYTEDYSENTLESLLLQYRNEQSPQLKARITNRIEMIPHRSSLISDAILFNPQTSLFVGYTKSPEKSITSTFTSEECLLDPFLSLFSTSENKMLIKHYSPSYISLQRSKGETQKNVSFGMNIIDRSILKLKSPLGTLVLNVNSEVFEALLNRLYDDDLIRFILTTPSSTEKIFDSGQESNRLDPENPPESKMLISKNAIEGGILTLYAFIDYDKLNTVYKQSKLLVLSIFIIVIMLLLFSTIIMSRFMQKRLAPLKIHMTSAQNGRFDDFIEIKRNDEIGLLEESYNEMVKQLDSYIEQVFTSKLKIQTAQLRILQQQINPHFMYNTLQSIQMSAMMNKDESTAKMVNLLGLIFRWAMDSNVALVRLSEELKYLNMYVTLQSMRNDLGLKLVQHIEIDSKDMFVPKLILQPLIENAITYGCFDIEPNVYISARTEKNFLLICIENKANEYDTQQAIRILNNIETDNNKTQIGMKNVHERIKMSYPRKEYLDKIGIIDISYQEEIMSLTLAFPISKSEQ